MTNRIVSEINKRTITIQITEDEIKDRLCSEAIQAEDLAAPDGIPLQGVVAKALRGKNRGGYVITITHDRGAQQAITTTKDA